MWRSGFASHRFHYEINEPLKCCLLILAGQCPVGSIASAPVVILEGVSEEEFDPTFLNKRVALEI